MNEPEKQHPISEEQKNYLVADFLKEDLDTLINDKTKLTEKLKIIQESTANKKQALDKAILEKETSDTVQVLSLELQQKELVLRDLETNLVALDAAIEKKRST